MTAQVALAPLPVSSFRDDVIRGLARHRKELPCKWLYDEAGSALFERICELPEYYPTRVELGILHAHLPEMAALLGPRCCVIEYGSGSGRKTRLLLDHLAAPVAYVPIDIARETLVRSSRELAAAYPTLEVRPLCADYTAEAPLPVLHARPERRVVFFPGSTLGNLTPPEAGAFLKHVATLCGPGGALLLGLDLEKDPEVLERAYDDAAGVTAEFNLNLLARINRELGADFDLVSFRHRAVYDRGLGRVEMHLVSARAQTVHMGRARFEFDAAEAILTECAYKWRLDDFERLARGAGFSVERVFTDPKGWFSVQYLTVD